VTGLKDSNPMWEGFRIRPRNLIPIQMENTIPRRARLDLNTPAEKAIYDAMQEVEKMPADEKLTEAVILLGKARDLIADFIDAQS